MLREKRVPPTKLRTVKILAISADPWYREDVNVALEKNNIAAEIPDLGPVINNKFAIQAIEQHPDAVWIIVDVILFFEPNLPELIQNLVPDIRKKLICFMPGPEYITIVRRQWGVHKDLTDISSLKESIKKLGVIHCTHQKDGHITCIGGICSCSS